MVLAARLFNPCPVGFVSVERPSKRSFIGAKRVARLWVENRISNIRGSFEGGIGAEFVESAKAVCAAVLRDRAPSSKLSS